MGDHVLGFANKFLGRAVVCDRVSCDSDRTPVIVEEYGTNFNGMQDISHVVGFVPRAMVIGDNVSLENTLCGIVFKQFLASGSVSEIGVCKQGGHHFIFHFDNGLSVLVAATSQVIAKDVGDAKHGLLILLTGCAAGTEDKLEEQETLINSLCSDTQKALEDFFGSPHIKEPERRGVIVFSCERATRQVLWEGASD